MSNTPIPPSGSSGQNSSAQNTQAPPSNAKIITLPEAIQQRVDAQNEALTIRGTVEIVRSDGSARVRTAEGHVEINIREGRTPPSRGDSVEITIQPRERGDAATSTGREIRAHIKEARPEAPEQRSSNTPVDVQVRPENNAAPAQQQAQPATPAREPLPADIRHAQGNTTLPPEGTVVRLEPLPRAVAESLPLPDVAQQVSASVIAPAVYSAQVIATNIISDVQDSVLQTRPTQIAGQAVAQIIPRISAAPDVPVQILQSFESGAPAQINATQIATVLPEATPQTIIPTPVQIVQTQIALRQNPNAFIQATAQGIAPQVSQTNISQAVVQAADQVTAPQIFQTQPSATGVALKAQPLNVSIDKILPPAVSVINPQATSEGLRASTPQAHALTVGQQNAQAVKPEALILQNQNAGALKGIVTNVTSGQLPVVSVFFPQLGSEPIFTLQFPSENITIGTQIQVTPQTISQNTNAAQVAAPPAFAPLGVPLPALLAPQPWPAMDDVLQTLARAAPQAASAMVASTPSPSNPAQMTPAILFFVAAVRGGDITQWLGSKATDILKTQRGGQALNKLMGETQTLSRVAAEPTPQDWRALNVPIYYEGDMHKIGLYYRHENDEHDDSERVKGTRFVFDLALDKMGKVQVDGLFRPVSDAGKRLDLVLRTEETFSQNTRAEMRQTYARALRDTGVAGELSFQNNPESWVTIQADDQNRLGVSA